MKIAIIITGGTIISTSSKADLALHIEPSTFISERLPDFRNRLEKHIQEGIHEDLELEIVLMKSGNTPHLILSEEIRPKDWLDLSAEIISADNRKVDGILILHGTDTLSYTAGALAFSIGYLDIPIVLTGASRPYDMSESEAMQNIIHSIRALIALKNIGGLYVLFGNRRTMKSYVHNGCRVRKTTSSPYFFKTTKGRPVGEVLADGKVVLSREKSLTNRMSIGRGLRKRMGEEPCRYSKRVCILKIFPGFDSSIIRCVVELGFSGILLELYESNTAMVQQGDLAYAIKKSVDSGITVVGISGSSPRVKGTELYITTKTLIDMGLIVVDGITCEAAYGKLLFFLDHLSRNKTDGGGLISTNMFLAEAFDENYFGEMGK